MSLTGWHGLLLVHLAVTLYMAGLIWMVQVVHYPLFDRVPKASFAAFERDHTRLISWVVMPPMVLELLTGIGLLFQIPQSPGLGFLPELLWLNLGLLLLNSLSTAVLQVPCHQRLSRGFDARVHCRLVHSNWVRTVIWSLKSLVVLWITWAVLTAGQTS